MKYTNLNNHIARKGEQPDFKEEIYHCNYCDKEYTIDQLTPEAYKGEHTGNYICDNCIIKTMFEDILNEDFATNEYKFTEDDIDHIIDVFKSRGYELIIKPL